MASTTSDAGPGTGIIRRVGALMPIPMDLGCYADPGMNTCLLHASYAYPPVGFPACDHVRVYFDSVIAYSWIVDIQIPLKPDAAVLSSEWHDNIFGHSRLLGPRIRAQLPSWHRLENGRVEVNGRRLPQT